MADTSTVSRFFERRRGFTTFGCSEGPGPSGATTDQYPDCKPATSSIKTAAAFA